MTRRALPTLLLGLLGLLAGLAATGCGRAYAEAAPKTPSAVPAALGDKKGEAEADDGVAAARAPREERPEPAKPEPAKDERLAFGQVSPAQPDKQGADTAALEPNRDASMIVYTARITMAVYQVEQGLATVEKIARDQGGFLALKRDREITIRVPRQKFDVTLAAIDKLGDVLHRDVSAQDVTDEFVDLEIRIKNARAMQTRLKALLEKAPVKEALEIEKELHRVTEELERLEGRLKLLRDKIAYSTITVAFEPRGSAIQATRIRLPFPWLQQLGLPNLLTLSEEKQP